MTGKLKKFGFGLAIVVAVIGLVLAFPLTYGAAEISTVVVDVWVPRDPALGSGGPLVVHYVPGTNGIGGSEALTGKVISETDVRKIKGALCKTRVLYGFYGSGIVTIKSPTTADAIFWRWNIILQVSLVKVGEDWKVTTVGQGGGHRATGKGFWNKFLDAVNKIAP